MSHGQVGRFHVDDGRGGDEMSVRSVPAPRRGERFQVVIEVSGPRKTKEFQQFTAELKELVDKYAGKIGARNLVKNRGGVRKG